MSQGHKYEDLKARVQQLANTTGKTYWIFTSSTADAWFATETEPELKTGMRSEKIVPAAARSPFPKDFKDFTEPQIQTYMQQMGHAVQDHLPGGLCPGTNKAFFALIVFDTPGLSHHVTNVARAGLIKALRLLADRLETEEGQVPEDPTGLDAG